MTAPINIGFGFGGNTSPPPQDALVLGTVTFLPEESPNELSFKLNQVTATHTLIGGSRTVQPIGPSMEDVTWTGYLFAGNVAFRISQIEAMQAAAVPVPLTYLIYGYTVIIKSFTWKMEHRWQAQYSITCTVVEDVSGQYTGAPAPGTDEQISTISAAAQTTLNEITTQDPAGTAAMLAICNSMFLVIEAAGVISQLTGPQQQALVETIEAAIIAIDAYLLTQGAI